MNVWRTNLTSQCPKASYMSKTTRGVKDGPDRNSPNNLYTRVSGLVPEAHCVLDILHPLCHI